jgi:Calcium-dependent channel, 7TM region, putative phosphate
VLLCAVHIADTPQTMIVTQITASLLLASHIRISMYASLHAVFDTLRLIVDTPAKVFTLLGESLPNVCGYFCIYIVIKFMSGLLIEMTRMISLLQHYILALVWSSQTARDKRAVVMGLRHYADAGWFAYPKYISQDLLVVVITFTFCCKSLSFFHIYYCYCKYVVMMVQ